MRGVFHWQERETVDEREEWAEEDETEHDDTEDQVDTEDAEEDTVENGLVERNENRDENEDVGDRRWGFFPSQLPGTEDDSSCRVWRMVWKRGAEMQRVLIRWGECCSRSRSILLLVAWAISIVLVFFWGCWKDCNRCKTEWFDDIDDCGEEEEEAVRVEGERCSKTSLGMDEKIKESWRASRGWSCST